MSTILEEPVDTLGDLLERLGDPASGWCGLLIRESELSASTRRRIATRR